MTSVFGNSETLEALFGLCGALEISPLAIFGTFGSHPKGIGFDSYIKATGANPTGQSPNNYIVRDLSRCRANEGKRLT